MSLITLPQLIGEFSLMKDEAYCQVLKQLTANTSSKPYVCRLNLATRVTLWIHYVPVFNACMSCDVWSRDSCQRGWRLLYILTAFHRCSEKPFLFKYLQHAYLSAGVLFQGAPLVSIIKAFFFRWYFH